MPGSIAPGMTGVALIDVDLSGFGRRELLLNLSARTKMMKNLVPEGHEAAWEQFILRPSALESLDESDEKARVSEDKNEIIVDTEVSQVVFDKETGIMKNFRIGEQDLIKDGKGFVPNFWRAPTDNDFGNNLPLRCADWKHASQVRSLNRISAKANGGKVFIRVAYTLIDPAGKKMADFNIDYTVSGDGRVHVENHYVKASSGLPETPRIGLTAELVGELQEVTWYGRGPGESYWDRKSGSRIGRYSGRVSDLYWPYIRPQENGNRSDVRWFSLTKPGKNVGILIWGLPEIDFSVHNQRIEDFESRERSDGRHTIDVPTRDLTTLNVDFKQMGLGGDNSWGAHTHDKYKLTDKEYRYSFIIEPKWIKGSPSPSSPSGEGHDR